MTRKPRRLGISYIENDNSRSITFFKRRAGLFKTAADLSTLTGTRIAIALESESGKMSSFGTPSAGPIIDSFLSGNTPVHPCVNEEEKAKIILLQNDLFKLDKEKYEETKRSKEALARSMEIQETSSKAKLVYGQIEDLSVEELNELLHDLLEVQQEINNRPRPQQPSYQLEVGAPKEPSLQWLSSSSSHSHIQLPPRRPLPWTTIRHDNLMPQHPLVQPQAQMMLSPNEAYQHSYNTQGLPVNGNISHPFSQSSMVSVLPPPSSSSSAQIASYNELPQSSSQQQPTTPLPIETELNPAEQPENHAGTQEFTAGHPFANHQWPSPIPCNEPYYDISFYGHNLNLGDPGNYGGQSVGEHDMPGPSGLHQQAYDCPYRIFFGYYSSEE